jgi:hypothetical protein
MPKVKIAPDLEWLCTYPFNPICNWKRARAQCRALLAVARAVARWRDYDGDGDGIMVPATEAKLTGAMVKASQSLERISKGGEEMTIWDEASADLSIVYADCETCEGWSDHEIVKKALARGRKLEELLKALTKWVPDSLCSCEPGDRWPCILHSARAELAEGEPLDRGEKKG